MIKKLILKWLLKKNRSKVDPKGSVTLKCEFCKRYRFVIETSPVWVRAKCDRCGNVKEIVG